MTTDFSRNYQPPGVYIEEDDSVVVSTTGVPPTVVAIVGPSRGFQTAVDQITLADAGARLTKKGVDLTTIVATRVSDRTVVDSGDYSSAKADDNGGQDYSVDITRASDAADDDGTPIFVTYQYTVEDYFDPKSLDNFEDVKDLFGEPLNLTPQQVGDTAYQFITSPISLAAKIAFENGASDLILCSTTPPPGTATTDAAKSTANRAALDAAYGKLSTLPSVNVVVALTEGIVSGDVNGVLTDLSVALDSAADDGFYQFGIIGFPAAVATAPDAILSGAGVKNRRVMLAYAGPGSVMMYSGANNTTFKVGHGYLAAAYGGKMASLPIQQSLTKQNLSSFSGLGGTPLSNSLKNQYAQAGVAIAEVNRLGGLSVRHAVTTDMTSVNTRESAVVRARDALVTMMQDNSTNSGLIGAPVDDDLLLSVKSLVSGMLETAVSDGIVNSYTGLAVRQTSTDPTVIEVKFAYKPAYPLNYIVISFSIDMSTGTTDLTDTTV